LLSCCNDEINNFILEYFQRICPETQVESFETFFTEELAPTLLYELRNKERREGEKDGGRERWREGKMEGGKDGGRDE
jgi:hypothetical protein